MNLVYRDHRVTSKPSKSVEDIIAEPFLNSCTGGHDRLFQARDEAVFYEEGHYAANGRQFICTLEVADVETIVPRGCGPSRTGLFRISVPL
jgi:hypothetical protein